MKTNIKYLGAYIIPIVVAISLLYKGWFSYAGVFVAFFAIPLLELFAPGTDENLYTEDEKSRNFNSFYDIVLYSNLPVLWGLLIWYFYTILYLPLETYEYIGLNLSLGIFLGAMGINVAHELGHRNNFWDQLFAKILLLPNLYTHFTIEHNRGHHLNVATDEDPASARYNEWLYAFWIRSVTMTYISAWELETKRLKHEGKNVFSRHNEMIWLQLLHFSYLFILWTLGSGSLLFSGIIVAVIGFLMLETVNYIEHYGLRRRKTESGRYERVQPWHSWNSNHDIGRIVLYELTRHSDHHFKATRKYQVLRHFDESPQLPYGYPMCMLISLIPPLWFVVMNPKVKEISLKNSVLPVL